ncbi:MAG: hypothetical protein O2930_09195 [Acidobacteria bacterium]|nr:hypothetical protein [Acidobacteriota bacterium]
MSPILVRPVREQLEHDRVIRLLQAKYKRKFDVSINPGREQTAPVVIGNSNWYPDLLLQSSDPRPKLLGTVEVETAESVNHLEAMSQWGTFGRLRAPLHLYVPVSSVDATRRLCASLGIKVSEIWAYNALGDQILFTLVQKAAGRKPLGRRDPKAATPARRATSKPTSARRAKPTRAPQRKTAGKKPVVRAAAPRKAVRAAKKVVKKQVANAKKKVAKKQVVRRNSKKVLKKSKSARSARVVRTVKKTSKPSRLKER